MHSKLKPLFLDLWMNRLSSSSSRTKSKTEKKVRESGEPCHELLPGPGAKFYHSKEKNKGDVRRVAEDPCCTIFTILNHFSSGDILLNSTGENDIPPRPMFLRGCREQKVPIRFFPCFELGGKRVRKLDECWKRRLRTISTIFHFSFV